MTRDRRSFLRTTATALTLPSLAVWGCEGGAGPRSGPQRDTPSSRRLDRAVLERWSPDAVLLAAPLASRPLAYLSRAEHRVYVEAGERDMAARLFAAYLSVSTGLWRIHLPGDDPRVPIMEGDEAREFIPSDLSEWDPRARPAEGDVRIVAGTPEPVTVDLACTPVLAGEGWVRADPIGFERLDGTAGRWGMETFGVVATGRHSSRRDCGGPGSPVRILTWAITDVGGP